MPRYPVEQYAAEWNPNSKAGKIIVKANGNQYPISINSPDAFAALMMMLSKDGVIINTEAPDFEVPFRSAGS